MTRRRTILATGLLLPLAACGPDPIDPQSQIGPNPPLPEPHQYLLPPMHVSSVVGWKEGEAPQVAAGLQVKALATGLKNPRSLLVLPNGDILVAESGGPTPPVNRPKEIIMGWLERKSHSPETRASASRCCGMPTATACPSSGASCSTSRIPPSAWRSSATTSTSPRPTR